MGNLDNFKEKLEFVGMPPEGMAEIDKLGTFAFAGVTTIDMTTISASEMTEIEGYFSQAGQTPEAKAHLDKIKSLLITPEEEE